MKEDYPKYVIEKRKELQEQLKIERGKGNTAILRYDKIIITKNHNERKLPSSPNNNKFPKQDKHTQAIKKIKNKQLSGNKVTRSNSISEDVLKPNMPNYLFNKKETKTNSSREGKSKNT